MRPLAAFVLAIGLVAGVLSLTAAPAAATPTATASDTTDLVHGQDIVVRGQGWDPDAWVTVLICADLTEDDTCETVGDHSYRPGPLGRFTVRGQVDVFLDIWPAPVDCRVQTCHLSVWSERIDWPPVPDPPPVVIPVTFDPDGPGPVRRDVEVSPTTDLVDGARLHVSGDGFDGDGFRPPEASIVTCRLPVQQVEHCDHTTARTVRVVGGSIEARVWIPAVLQIGGWWEEPVPYDCRTGECELLVIDGYWEETGESWSEAGLVPLDFDPAAPLRPDPSATADPADGVDDGQRVHLGAASFNAGGAVVVRQCAGPLRWDGYPHRCHAGVVRATAGEDGTVDRWVRVHRTVVNENGRRWNCRARPCWLVVVQESGEEPRVARARLRFA